MLPASWSQTVYVADGSVWVLGNAPDAAGPIYVDTLYRLDPASGEFLEHITFDDGSVIAPRTPLDDTWFRSDAGLQRFDTATQTFGPAVDVGTDGYDNVVSDGAGGAWVVSSTANGERTAISYVDASGGVTEVATITPRATPSGSWGRRTPMTHRPQRLGRAVPGLGHPRRPIQPVTRELRPRGP
jgi:hypothetical protein